MLANIVIKQWKHQTKFEPVFFIRYCRHRNHRSQLWTHPEKLLNTNPKQRPIRFAVVYVVINTRPNNTTTAMTIGPLIELGVFVFLFMRYTPTEDGDQLWTFKDFFKCDQENVQKFMSKKCGRLIDCPEISKWIQWMVGANQFIGLFENSKLELKIWCQRNRFFFCAHIFASILSNQICTYDQSISWAN